jgi:hypothetical protein
VSRASGDTQQQVVRSIIVFRVLEANPKMVLLGSFCCGKQKSIEKNRRTRYL